MNQKKAKELKKDVADRLYESPENKEQKKNLYADPDFKKIYRARKKNYINGISQI